jgi:hypothetical protein
VGDTGAFVRRALDNALENGYADLISGPIEEIAVDLATYSSDLEGRAVEQLRSHIEAWLADRPEVRRG